MGRQYEVCWTASEASGGPIPRRHTRQEGCDSDNHVSQLCDISINETEGEKTRKIE